LALPLFDDYFDCMQFKTEEGRESESSERLNDGHQSLDSAFQNVFANSISPMAVLQNIQQVAMLARPVRQK
jgi:hypothetical protein